MDEAPSAGSGATRDAIGSNTLKVHLIKRRINTRDATTTVRDEYFDEALYATTNARYCVTGGRK